MKTNRNTEVMTKNVLDAIFDTGARDGKILMLSRCTRLHAPKDKMNYKMLFSYGTSVIV